MGPGPANAYPRVLAAQSLPMLGHMHPPFFKIMDEIQEGLKYLFQTDLGNTLLISGTGHAGMEACIANAIEPGEKIVVGNNGIWGMRVADLAARYGGTYSQTWLDALIFTCYPQQDFALTMLVEACMNAVAGASEASLHPCSKRLQHAHFCCLSLQIPSCFQQSSCCIVSKCANHQRSA